MIVLAQNLCPGDFILQLQYSDIAQPCRPFYNGLVISAPRAGTDDCIHCAILSAHNLTTRLAIFDYSDECEILR